MSALGVWCLRCPICDYEFIPIYGRVGDSGAAHCKKCGWQCEWAFIFQANIRLPVVEVKDWPNGFPNPIHFVTRQPKLESDE